MNSLDNFARLEWHTLKPSLTWRVLLLYAVVAGFITVTISSDTVGPIVPPLAVAMMVVVMFAGTPFAMAERCNLDGLYVTLGVHRRQVVRGRFVFFVVFAATIIVGGCLVAAILSLALGRGVPWDGLGYGALASFLAACLLVFVQLPVYFRLGATKARYAAKLPVLILIFALGAVASLLAQDRPIPQILASLAESAAIVAAAAAVAVALIGAVAYRVAVALYDNREF